MFEGRRTDRRVYYFHGFDPATTVRYRRIFRAAVSRFDAAIEDLDGADGWRVVRDGHTTEIEYCRYEDLVRAWQSGPFLERLKRGISAILGYVQDGALRKLARRAPRNLGLVLSPIIFLCAGLTVALALLIAGNASAVAIGAAVAVLLVLAGLMRLLYLDLVMDLFAYMRVLARGHGAVYDAYLHRAEVMARRLIPGDAAETVVVGHSLGGVTAILALDAALSGWPENRQLSLLTLGSTHGTVLSQEGAGRDRLAGAIRRIASDRRVFWVDVSATRDAFCVPLTDPLLFTGPASKACSPLVLSTRLDAAPRIDGDRRTTFAAMRRHMGYLTAPRDGVGFDYADTISGAPTMRERFAQRRNSPKAEMLSG